MEKEACGIQTQEGDKKRSKDLDNGKATHMESQLEKNNHVCQK